MKTNSISNKSWWRGCRHTLMLLALFTLHSSLFVSEAQAQQRQDALYIFRNDGQFNAFFYGDIQRMCYSNIDTLGVEHEDYVTQEVWALDTVYRIPVSAIDSISFVTPENIIKKDVFSPDASIVNYIVASDSVSWIRLAKNTPKGLIPKVGDKLYIQQSSDLIPDSFVGLVTSVTEASDGITVVTSDVEITDIFDRLVAKAAAASPKLQAGARKAIFDGAELTYTPEEPIDLPVFTGTYPLQGSYALGSWGPVEFSGDATGSVSISAHLSLQVRLFLYVDVLSGMIQADETFNYTNEVTKSIAIAGSITGHVDVPFKGVSKKLSNFFKLNLSAGWFFDAQFTGLDLTYSYKSTDVGMAKQTMQGNFFKDEEITPIWRTQGVITGDEPEWKLNSSNSWALSTGFYAEASFSAAAPYSKKPSKDNKAEVKVRLEGGLKASFQLPKFDAKSLGYELYKLIKSQTVYTLLDKENDIGWSLYGKLSLSYKFGKLTNSFNPELSIAKSNTYGAVPKITAIGVSQDDKAKYPKAWRYRLTSPISRDLFPGMGVNVGFQVTNEDGTKSIARKCTLPWFGNRSLDSGLEAYDTNSGTYSEVFDDIDPGKGGMATYVAYPMVTLPMSGLPVLVDKKKTFKVPEAHFDIENRNIVAIEEDVVERSLDLKVIPNMKNVEVTCDAKWLKQNFYGHEHTDDYLALSWEPLPDTTFQRKAVINLKGFSSHEPKEVLVEDSIIFIQSRPSLRLSADSLIFDLEGGAKTVEILNNNLKDVRIPINYHETEKWLKVTLKDDIITVTVEKSEEPYRAVYVVVWGNTPNGALVERGFWVRQYTNEALPTVNPKTLVFDTKGGTQTADFYKAVYPYQGVFVSDEGKKWAKAQMDATGTVTVTVDPYEDERSCTVICWASDKPNPTEAEMVKVPLTVVQQKPATFKIMEVDAMFSTVAKFTEKDKEYPWRTTASHDFITYGDKKNAEITYYEEGNDLYVECRGQDKQPGDWTASATLSFTVENWKDRSKVKITNIDFNQTPNSYSGWYSETRAKVTTAPVTEYETDYPDPYNLPERIPMWIETKAEIADGVVFDSWNYRDKDRKYEYVPSQDNSVNIYIDINPWGDLIDYENPWGDDDDDDWGDDDGDWGDWSRSAVKKAKRLKGSNVLERRVLEQLRKAGSQNK